MEMNKDYFILNYKSRLFDAMENMKSNGMTDWISIIENCFQALKVVYYKVDNESPRQFIRDFVSNDEDPFSPEFIDSVLVKSLLHDSNIINQGEINKIPSLNHFQLGFHFQYNEIEIGCLFLSVPDDVLLHISTEICHAFTAESNKFLHMFQKMSMIIEEENKFKELFRVTEKFHSSMNVENVLSEIISTLKRVFPNFEYNLLISNDNHYDNELPVKPLQYDSADDVAMESFVSGNIRISTSCSMQRTRLYAPLHGKQGVYGVLEVITYASFVFKTSEIEFIGLLANTAGSAIENAKLYQQSQGLIEDLQLINETSRILNGSSRLQETIQFLKSQISKSFSVSVENIGFALINEDSSYSLLEGSSDFLLSEEGKGYVQFILDSMQKQTDSLLISDLTGKLSNEQLKYSSMMAVPMIQGNTLRGFCVALHEKPYYFSFDMFKLFQSLIHHSTLAVTNSILRERLEKMVITDQLTQLFAKSYLNNQIKQSMISDEEGTFILLDIDNFKEVNDTFGHQVGDTVLVQVANLILENIRSSDIGARWGGEELAIYLPGVTLKTGSYVAKRLVKAVQENTNPQITVSCGVSYWNKKRKDEARHLFHRADMGLYNAKSLGKNQVVIKEDCKKIPM